MKRIISLLLIAVLLTASLLSCDTQKSNKVCITVKDYGKIYVELYPDIAPETVKNFKNLVADGFYDGLTFHRVVSGFMIQGGDPKGNGSGGSDEKINGEFSLNGFKNELKHERGVISMARSGSAYDKYIAAGYPLDYFPLDIQTEIIDSYNSASSQFFIMHETTESLDGSYAAFGKVYEGMDIVDKIAQIETAYSSSGEKSSPITPIVIESIKFVE